MMDLPNTEDASGSALVLMSRDRLTAFALEAQQQRICKPASDPERGDFYLWVEGFIHSHRHVTAGEGHCRVSRVLDSSKQYLAVCIDLVNRVPAAKIGIQEGFPYHYSICSFEEDNFHYCQKYCRQRLELNVTSWTVADWWYWRRHLPGAWAEDRSVQQAARGQGCKLHGQQLISSSVTASMQIMSLRGDHAGQSEALAWTATNFDETASCSTWEASVYRSVIAPRMLDCINGSGVYKHKNKTTRMLTTHTHSIARRKSPYAATNSKTRATATNCGTSWTYWPHLV